MSFITLEEQETTVNFSRMQDTVDIWTSDKTVMTKLDKLCSTAPDFYKLTAEHKAQDDAGTIISKEYQISDKGLLSFRAIKQKRTLTDEQRRILSERMKDARANGVI